MNSLDAVDSNGVEPISISDSRKSPIGFLGLAALGATLMMAACGGGGGGSETPSQVSSSMPQPPSPPSTPGNQPPSIAGAPPNSVVQNTQYSFLPNATDPEGDSLTFSIANMPAWASFDPSTGALGGTPGLGDIGTYQNITISVFDAQGAVVMLPGFTIDVLATALGSVTLSWIPPTNRTDASPLTDLAGYRFYWGTVSGNYTSSATVNNPGVSSYVVDQLAPATWYFVATALDSAGVESRFSNETLIVVP